MGRVDVLDDIEDLVRDINDARDQFSRVYCLSAIESINRRIQFQRGKCTGTDSRVNDCARKILQCFDNFKREGGPLHDWILVNLSQLLSHIVKEFAVADEVMWEMILSGFNLMRSRNLTCVSLGLHLCCGGIKRVRRLDSRVSQVVSKILQMSAKLTAQDATIRNGLITFITRACQNDALLPHLTSSAIQAIHNTIIRTASDDRGADHRTAECMDAFIRGFPQWDTRSEIFRLSLNAKQAYSS